MSKPRRRDVIALAAAATVDPRSAEKALQQGPYSVRGLAGDRLAEAMRELGLTQVEQTEGAGCES
jgi:hypothetical protein